LSKIRVLLADDNGQVLEYVREILSANGCEVIGTATDGQSGVDVAAELLPDVLVLDVFMRILNRIRAARRMLEVNPSIKVVFLTICKDPATCRAALEIGAFGYVIKPRLANDLIPAIEHARDGRRFVSPGCEQFSNKSSPFLIHASEMASWLRILAKAVFCAISG